MEKNLKIVFLVVLFIVTVCHGEVEIAQISTNVICHTDDDCKKVLNCSAIFPPKRGCTRVVCINGGCSCVCKLSEIQEIKL
ncbi:hypothetical protein Lal_00037474 [Lupinus albus]|uniref:Uncharacterized protein n=1 Tax=Lupinus albus TaxID=3870 RepID=A0A6A4P5Y2_LUPAL|nr:hypothetical protein Lalb_Chr18g0054951 [Lupinus albus]KAF1890903.1 hypothetical protein Lal_00037474 [Lupinus albus]